MVLCTSSLLDDGFASESGGEWTVPFGELTIPEDDVSDTRLRELCGGKLAEKKELKIKSEAQAFPSKPKSEAKSKGDHGSPREQDKVVCKRSSVGAVKAESGRNTEAAEASCEDINLSSLVPVNGVPKVVQKVREKLEQRPDPKEARESRKRITLAKGVLKRTSLEFNSFQKAHWDTLRTPLPKGHWNDFLDGVAGSKDITCSVCIGLMSTHSIPSLKEEMLREREEEVETQAPAEDCLALVVYDPNYAQKRADDEDQGAPRKRPRAGRPRKGEEILFNIFTFIQEERPGMYRHLSETEACVFFVWFNVVLFFVHL